MYLYLQNLSKRLSILYETMQTLQWSQKSKIPPRDSLLYLENKEFAINLILTLLISAAYSIYINKNLNLFYYCPPSLKRKFL